MDKSTLSNYGWIVIAVLVLAVMVALASPFGYFIENAVQNTTQGLFDVEQKAMGAASLIIPDQEFEDNTQVFTFYIDGIPTSFQEEYGMTCGEWCNSIYNPTPTEENTIYVKYSESLGLFGVYLYDSYGGMNVGDIFDNDGSVGFDDVINTNGSYHT